MVCAPRLRRGIFEMNGIREKQDSPRVEPAEELPSLSTGWPSRAKLAAGLTAALVLAFSKPLTALFAYALGAEIHSHVVLVPFIVAYLVGIRRGTLPAPGRTSVAGVVAALAPGMFALRLVWSGGPAEWALSATDRLSAFALAFVCFVIAVGFLAMGRRWMAACAFPAAFLFFMVPLPDRAVEALEHGSKLASAEAADLFFRMTGTPVLREGTVFQLPGIVVEVAQECSGIRSSLVLFITGILAAHLLLRSPWRRAVLVAAVIPLGILRNGFRILVICLLCVNYGPHMIHHVIHQRGGPVFFALSLVPLFFLLWWLRRGEARRAKGGEAAVEVAAR